MTQGEGASPILELPKLKKITKRNIGRVDRDHQRGWEVAGPLFSAGCLSITLTEKPHYSGDRHLPDVHYISLVVQGKMKFQCGNQTIIARRGDLVFTPAGTTLQRSGIGPIIWLYFQLEDIPAWTSLKEIGPYVRKYESADLMYILTRRITGALRSQDVYSIHVARESSATMVDLLRRELRQSSNPWYSKRMSSFVNIIDRVHERPDQKWDREIIAQELNMSVSALTREFNRIFNMPPSKMVASIRMDIASRRLINTDLSLSDIAHSVGYESPFSFSRLFKKYVGVSPEHYRTMPAEDRHKQDRRT